MHQLLTKIKTNRINEWIIGRRVILFTIIIAIITLFNLLNYIGNELGGNYKWLFLPSDSFGIPKELKDDLGMTTLYTKDDSGWDGQFYYYISNDILGNKGYDKYMDAPAYRYQRIGLPAIAFTVSKLFLQKHVTVPIYILTNLLLILAAAYALGRWLVKFNKSILYILPWFFSIGVQMTLRYGLVDGAADALIILAVIMLIERKYIPYTIFMTLGCLTREGYIIIALFAFLFGFLGLLDRSKRYSIKFASLLAIPGVFFVLWYLYVTIKFGEFPYRQAINVTQFFLTGFIEFFIKAIRNHNLYEIVGLLIYIITIASALVLSFLKGCREKVYWIFIPYIILLGSFGSTVMCDKSGYLKGISFLYALIVISLYRGQDIPNKSFFMITRTLIDAFLIVTLVASMFSLTHRFEVMKERYGEVLGTSEEALPLRDYSCNISVLKEEYNKYSNIPFSGFFTQPYCIFTVQLTNTSNNTWYQKVNNDGTGAVYVSSQFLQTKDKKKVILEGDTNRLPTNLNPGNKSTLEVYVKYPKQKGDYILRIMLIQKGITWFDQKGSNYVDIPVTIK